MKAILAILTLSALSLYAQDAPPLPQDIATVRESWTKARSAAIAPLDRKYLDALKLAKDRATRDGKLVEANQIAAEIERVLPDMVAIAPQGFQSSDQSINRAETKRRVTNTQWTYKSSEAEWTITLKTRDVCVWFNAAKNFTTNGTWDVEGSGHIEIQFPGENIKRTVKFDQNFYAAAVTVDGHPHKAGTLTRTK